MAKAVRGARGPDGLVRVLVVQGPVRMGPMAGAMVGRGAPVMAAVRVRLTVGRSVGLLVV
ncbi:hypothetical protein [Nonomuraea sp. NPDC049684]|uniref:hypothetical protein n=1 Tax=Nonomuraea sp. NPDC049684 TaxID=3364356 RepID=UPI0037A9F381